MTEQRLASSRLPGTILALLVAGATAGCASLPASSTSVARAPCETETNAVVVCRGGYATVFERSFAAGPICRC